MKQHTIHYYEWEELADYLSQEHGFVYTTIEAFQLYLARRMNLSRLENGKPITINFSHKHYLESTSPHKEILSGAVLEILTTLEEVGLISGNKPMTIIKGLQ